jgi:hypothetical protein
MHFTKKLAIFEISVLVSCDKSSQLSIMPNELLKSVAFDITEMVYKISVGALGIINKMITGG